MNNFKLSFEQLFSAFKDSFMLAFTKFKEQKVIKSYKSSIKGSLKVGFQLLFLSNYLLKGVSSSKRNTKGTYHQLFNFLLQLLKAKKGAKGCWKEITFFLMHSRQTPLLVSGVLGPFPSIVLVSYSFSINNFPYPCFTVDSHLQAK